MTVQIQLFGDFSLHVNGKAVAVRAQKSRALLAWLACHQPVPQPRDRLAGLLWPDNSSANAKASLRQAVAGLRRELPQAALVGRAEYLEFEPEIVTSDVAQFRGVTELGDLALLKTKLGVYRGDLLDGFNARSQPFDEWLLIERENLRQQALAGYVRLIEAEQSAGALADAIATGQRLLTLDPLQESVHCQMMLMYAELGQIGAARRQFKHCRDSLQRELGVPPSPETIAVFKRLGTSDQPSSVATPARANRENSDSDADRRAALPSIAVLPFRNMSSDAEHGYLADGMTEELINLLTSSANWQVSARNVSFHFREKQTDPRKVGEELGVGYVVDGSIRNLGARIRISASLIGCADGIQIWSERYDRPLTDIFDVQDEVVHAIFRTLKNRLGFAERERVRRTPKQSLDAWGLLMKAMQVNVIDMDSLTERLELVREALHIDPGYPRAHAYLSMQLFTAIARGMSRDRKGDAAEAGVHAETALANGSSDTIVLEMCAGGLAAVGQTKHALGLAERAFELTGSPDPLLVAVLMWNGRLAEAQRYCEEVVDRMPANVPLPPGELRPVALLGNLCMLAGDLERALELGLRDQRANPGNFFAHVNVANVHGLLGQPAEALAAWELAQAIVPALSVKLFARGYAKVFVDQTLAAKFSEGLVAAGLK